MILPREGVTICGNGTPTVVAAAMHTNTTIHHSAFNLARVQDGFRQRLKVTGLPPRTEVDLLRPNGGRTTTQGTKSLWKTYFTC